MPIVDSVVVTETLQADGRRSVLERHTDHQGRTYDVPYFAAADLDIEQVLNLRAVNIGREIDAKEAAAAAAAEFRIPLTKYEFRQRFAPAERAACDAFNAGFEAHPALSAEQKAAIRTGLEDFRAASAVDPVLAMPMLQMYEALGLIAPGRASEIGAQQ